ncbi:MAG: class I SAM-dependent methyltransferase [Patescibacteria group bacterium]|nr:class I SAM-dependent methyltransferase [Patescibacteria group bacterium]
MKTHSEIKKEEWRDKTADQRTKSRSKYMAAPSAGPGILKKYEELLDQALAGKKNFQACVFGVTPETRDMVFKRGGDLTMIDISPDMITKTAPLMEYANSPKEKIVVGDWLQSGLPGDSFDLILGDGVENNIAFKDHDKFFAEINRLLKKGGCVILREVIFNPQREIEKVEEIDQGYAAGNIHWFDAYIDLRLYSDISAKAKSGEFAYEMGKFYEEIDAAHQQGRLDDKLYNDLGNLRGKIKHTFVSRPIFEEMFKKYFELIAVEGTSDFNFSKDTMLFFFGRAKK